jgi:hypothetical protein
MGGNGSEELMAQDNIHHRNLVQDKQVTLERVLLVLLELPLAGSNSRRR